MVYYPDCPFCGNASMSIVDVEIENTQLKGIQCDNPMCKKYVGFYKDDSARLKELSESIDDLDSRVSDLE